MIALACLLLAMGTNAQQAVASYSRSQLAMQTDLVTTVQGQNKIMGNGVQDLGEVLLHHWSVFSRIGRMLVEAEASLVFKKEIADRRISIDGTMTKDQDRGTIVLRATARQVLNEWNNNYGQGRRQTFSNRGRGCHPQGQPAPQSQNQGQKYSSQGQKVRAATQANKGLTLALQGQNQVVLPVEGLVLGCHCDFHLHLPRRTSQGCYTCGRFGCHSRLHAEPLQNQESSQGHGNSPSQTQQQESLPQENETRGLRQGDRSPPGSYNSPSSHCASA